MTEQGTEFSQKGFESMTAEEIAATQESEVAITVGDPVPASEQNNATVGCRCVMAARFDGDCCGETLDD